MPRRRKKKKVIKFDHYKIALILLISGGLYFFAYFFAPGSPIFLFFRKYIGVAFGVQYGVDIFFAIGLLISGLMFFKKKVSTLLLKQFFILEFLISGVLNFPIIDGISMNYEKFGGYASFPLIFILDKMFGGQASAIKIFIVLLLLACIIWILWTLNFSLPKIDFSSSIESFETKNKKKAAKAVSKKEKISKKDLIKKLESAKTKSSSEDFRVEKSDNGDLKEKIFKNIVKTKVENKVKQQEYEKKYKMIKFDEGKPTFDLDLLEKNIVGEVKVDEEFLMNKARALQEKLQEFNVTVEIKGFDIGPSVIQIKIKPDAGIRLSKIEHLASDIGLALKTRALRVVAPIPNSDLVGIQIPNPNPMIVRLGDIFHSREFLESMQVSEMNLALGKSIEGKIVVKALDKMPHLLVAGATGSGKSVGINDFIMSLIYQNSPSELKFLMVDPKQVELELYSGIPYMLGPIVTEPDKAIRLLKRAVQEMERRYTVLKEHRVKKLSEYNAKVIGDKMYRIVIVIDELADLMMAGKKKEVELAITRIAQKARAVGIHLMVATQRPSVDVITGLIKANMPTRIAFGVVSEVDSRTILGRKGAEELIGKGDLLYIDPTTKYPIRVQAPYIDTNEIEKVVSFLKKKYMNGISEEEIYHPEVVKVLEDNAEMAIDSMFTTGGSGKKSSDEELIQQAIEIIRQNRKASATLLQRKLNVGFARAARIMDALEERGIVGPQMGSKPREIYI